MKKFLYKNRKGVVLIMSMCLYICLVLVLFALLSHNNPQVLRLSRTSVVMLFAFILSSYLLTNIYGKYDIGVRKSKPIVISVSLSAFFSDIVTFALLVIMNTNQTTNNAMYPYFWNDVLLVLLAFVWQVIIIFIMTYGGHYLYFSFVPPEKCVIVSNGSKDDVVHLVKAIKKYKKQYSICKVIKYDDENLYEELQKYESVFMDALPPEPSRTILEYCYKNYKKVYKSVGITDLLTNTARVMMLSDQSFLASEVREKNMHQRIVKRIADILISIIGLSIAGPFILIAMVAIKLEDGGKAIFKQQRVTINGSFFMLYKLRTMKENADGSLVVNEKDGRITRVGHFLRKFRIDEVPQFVNVLKGEMSVVGPRAEMADRVYMSIQELPEYSYRYRMKAGITGYAQINGKYNTSARDKLMLDLTYIQTFTLWNDTKIMFQTIMVLLRPDKSTEAYDKNDLKHKEQLEKEVSEQFKKEKNE